MDFKNYDNGSNLGKEGLWTTLKESDIRISRSGTSISCQFTDH